MDDPSSNLGIIVLAILVLLTAFFSGGEIAIITANKIRLRQKAEQGFRPAKIALHLVDNPSYFFSFIQIGNNSLNIAIGILSGILAIRVWHKDPFLVGVLMTLMVIVFGEIVPKGVAAQQADRLSLLIAPIMRVLIIIFYPLIWFLALITNFLIKIFGGKTDKKTPFVTEEEIKMLVKVGEEEGVLEEGERKMIHSIFEFGDTIVREVMVPRIDITSVEVKAPLKEVLEKIIQEGHSRIPVYEETIDNIIGVLYAKDLLQCFKEDKHQVNLREIVRPAYFVPESKKVSDLFKELRKEKVHMAIVVDEYGGVGGLVTIEDLLEEIVGEIQDEYDVEEPEVQVIDKTTALVDARLNIKEANEILAINLPTEEVDTVGGFVYSYLGRVPKVGEEIEWENLKIVITKVEAQRILRVKIKKQKAEETAGGEDSKII